MQSGFMKLQPNRYFLLKSIFGRCRSTALKMTKLTYLISSRIFGRTCSKSDRSIVTAWALYLFHTMKYNLGLIFPVSNYPVGKLQYCGSARLLGCLRNMKRKSPTLLHLGTFTLRNRWQTVGHLLQNALKCLEEEG